MAWQDPNLVPVKAFYDGVNTVNFLAALSFDRHRTVRQFVAETLVHWTISLEDRYDHEAR